MKDFNPPPIPRLVSAVQARPNSAANPETTPALSFVLPFTPHQTFHNPHKHIKHILELYLHKHNFSLHTLSDCSWLCSLALRLASVSADHAVAIEPLRDAPAPGSMEFTRKPGSVSIALYYISLLSGNINNRDHLVGRPTKEVLPGKPFRCANIS